MNLSLNRLLGVSAFLLMPSIALAAVIEISSVDQYNKLAKSDKPMVAMFTATWCGPCKATKPHFINLAKSMTDVTFCIVDVDKQALKSITSGIRGIPTFKFVHKGAVKSTTSGGRSRSELEQMIKKFTATCPKSS